MKKYFFSALLLGCCNFLLAQGVRINLYSSYVFDDYFEAYSDSYNYYHGTVEGGHQWGAGLEFSRNPAYSFEIVYYNFHTNAPTTWQSGQFDIMNFEDLR